MTVDTDLLNPYMDAFSKLKDSKGLKTKKIRIYIIWNDDPDTSSMDNLSDTSSTLKADSSAILDVSVAFTQVAQ